MRKEFSKKKKMVLTMAVLGCLLSGCGSAYSDNKSADVYNAPESYGISNNYDTGDYAAEEMAVDSVESYSENDAGSSNVDVTAGIDEGATAKPANAQKIIKTYNYTYDTEKFDEAYAYLREQIESCQGYVSDSNMSGTGYRRLTLTARIPVNQCDGFVKQLGSLGTVVSQSETAEDITLQYNDTESRIKSLKTEQDRIIELLKEADDLDTIITLESRATEIRYELERNESQKNLYDDLVAYCTVHINLNEVSYTVEVDDSTVFSRIKTGLATTFRDISYDFTNFIVAFIINLPYLIIWAVIIFVIVKIIRSIIRKRKAKKNGNPKEAKKKNVKNKKVASKDEVVNQDNQEDVSIDNLEKNVDTNQKESDK